MSAFTVAVRRWGRAQVVAPRGAEMRKIIIGATTSLDGVMQGPGGPHEDPIGGFRYGGWVAPYFDAVAGEALGEMFAQPRRLEGVRLRCDGEQVLP
jgi:hypothetical protein